MALSETVQNAWLAFAKTGVPSDEQLIDWPAYSQTNPASMVFDQETQLKTEVFSGQKDFWQGLL